MHIAREMLGTEMSAASSSSHDAWIGRTLGGRYRVSRPLGEGGIGCVYVAEHLTLGRNVALKMLHPHLASTPAVRQRFEREARALSKLSHPNVVGVVDFGSDGDALYIVMELVDGETLAERMSREPPNVPCALEIMRQIVRALAYAHGTGIVHRDLKPGNVLVRRLPDGLDHVTVLDFGLAKFLDEEGAAVVTRNGVVLGTPAYMAPEQAMGDTATTTADVYAASLILFELLTGKRPFPGDEPSEIFRAHLLAPIPRLADMHAGLGVSDEIEALIQRGLDKTASRRFPDARALLAALDASPELAARQSLTHISGSTSLDSRDSGTVARPPSAPAQYASFMLGAPVEPSVVSGVAPAPPSRAPHTAVTQLERPPQALQLSLPVLPEEDRPAPRSSRRLIVTVTLLVTVLLAAAAAVAVVYVLPMRQRPAAVAPGTSRAAASGSSTSGVTSGETPSRGPKRDPWAEPVPTEIAGLHAAITRGEKPARSALQPLFRYASMHRTDARGLLLLARTYADRGWHNDAMNAYRDAYARDPSSRGDARMLPDLVQMASLERFDDRAREYVVLWFGEEALPLVATRIAETTDTHARTLLERLRAALVAQR